MLKNKLWAKYNTRGDGFSAWDEAEAAVMGVGVKRGWRLETAGRSSLYFLMTCRTKIPLGLFDFTFNSLTHHRVQPCFGFVKVFLNGLDSRQ